MTGGSSVACSSSNVQLVCTTLRTTRSGTLTKPLLDQCSQRSRSKHWEQIFALLVSTLHWKGARDVKLKNFHNEKLCLSIPVIWKGDGSMDLCVLWRKSGAKGFSWTNHGGVWWLCAPSKFTTKESYTEILRFFMSRSHKSCKLYVDDVARGHAGTIPDHFLESIGCKRVRIQGLCTGFIQPADRPQTNQKLKRIAKRLLKTSPLTHNTF